MLLGLGLGLGGGLLKSVVSDGPRREAQRRAQAETTRWSPWTGMVAPEPQTQFDPLGSALQFGTTGAMMQQGIEGAAKSDAFNEKLLNAYEQQSPAAQTFGAPMGMGPVASGSSYGSMLKSAYPQSSSPFGRSSFASMHFPGRG